MKTFSEWCDRYEYDPSSDESRADYDEYRENLEILQSLADTFFSEDD